MNDNKLTTPTPGLEKATEDNCCESRQNWNPMKRTLLYLLISLVAMMGFAIGRKTNYEADSVDLVNRSGVEAIIEFEDAKHPDVIEKHFEPIVLRDTVQVIVRDTIVVEKRVEVPVVRRVIERDTVYVRTGLSSDQLTIHSKPTARTVAGYLQQKFNTGCFDTHFLAETYNNSQSQYVRVANPTRHYRSGCSFNKYLDKTPWTDAEEFSKKLLQFIKSGGHGMTNDFLMTGGEIIVNYSYNQTIRLSRAHLINQYEPIQ